MIDCKHLVATKNNDIGAKGCTCIRISHRATVRDGVLKSGYTSAIFVDMGAKDDGTCYCDLLLSKQLLPVIYHVSSEFLF